MPFVACWRMNSLAAEIRRAVHIRRRKPLHNPLERKMQHSPLAAAWPSAAQGVVQKTGRSEASALEIRHQRRERRHGLLAYQRVIVDSKHLYLAWYAYARQAAGVEDMLGPLVKSRPDSAGLRKRLKPCDQRIFLLKPRRLLRSREDVKSESVRPSWCCLSASPRHQRRDGIFEQRKETCKHAAGLVFGGTSLHHRSYMNILLWKTYVDHGKFQQLAARGKFEYGDAKGALKMLEDHNWYKILDPGWQGTRLTSECMNLRRNGWGDEAHPDTCVASLYTNYVLGITPLEPGFRVFAFNPLAADLIDSASGEVPTPYGTIKAAWWHEGGRLRWKVSPPSGARCKTLLPK